MPMRPGKPAIIWAMVISSKSMSLSFILSLPPMRRSAMRSVAMTFST